MRTLLPLILTLLFVPPFQGQDSSPVVVVSHKLSKTKQTEDKVEVPTNGPAPAMISQNKNFARNGRVNDPAGSRDPNQDTIDGRSAAIERSVQESRTRQPKTIDAYSYKIKVQNQTSQAVNMLFLEYQFIERSNPENVTSRQFLCVANLKPGKDKEIQALTLNGPPDVVNVKSLEKDSANQFEEKVVINRIEYSDGSHWQRKDWKFSEITDSYLRVTSTPWTTQACRGL